MSKEKFDVVINEWKNNTLNSGAEVIFDIISLEEIYKENNTQINRSYYQAVAEPEITRHSQLSVLTYTSLDLLKLDGDGNIISSETIDYQIINV